MKRRDVLKSGLGVLGTNSLARAFGPAFGLCPILTTSANASGSVPVVDIHCHVFNAHDLPIFGFVKNVLFREAKEHKKSLGSIEKIFFQFLQVASKWIHEKAYSAEDEEKFLDAMSKRQKTRPTAAEIQKREEKLLTEFFIEIKNGYKNMDRSKLKRAQRLWGWRGPLYIMDKLRRNLFPERFPRRKTNRDAIRQTLNEIKPHHMAKRVFEKDTKTSRLFKWVMLLTRYRFQIVEELSRFHKNGVQLVTPALVDYDMWLDDVAPSSIAAQVNVLDKISKQYHSTNSEKNVPLHGFVAFDPLREAFFRMGAKEAKFSSFEVVKDAILNKGFVGVKMYPPMGFFPLENKAKLKFKRLPNHVKKLARKLGKDHALTKTLDDVLDDYYVWCRDFGVSILAHATNSNGAGKGYSRRADPLHWKAVTSKYPELNICLAHMGRFDEAIPSKKKPKPLETETWEWHFAELFEAEESAQIYCDLSYLLVPYRKHDDKTSGQYNYIVGRFKSLISKFPGIENRILFGSDWIMLGTDAQVPDGSTEKSHLDFVIEFCKDVGLADRIDEIFGQNAIRFLGLDKDLQRGNRSRLLEYYGTSDRVAWLKDIPVNV